jgi:2,4-dienoyl-CoA reductase-like NADH-dependent reductase (Old Yellow Enzyme family)
MKKLFDLTKSVKKTLKNRYISSAVCEKTTDGHINKYILELYKKLAQGGVATMITGFTLVDEAEKSFPMLAFYNDSFNE